MTIGQAIVLYVTGTIAGFVNTVAGGGSAITIPFLVEMVGANVANGTNRIAILLASVTASTSFTRGGVTNWREVKTLVAPTVVGAGLGAWAATNVSTEDMQSVFGLVLLMVAGSALIKPGRWTLEREPGLAWPLGPIVFLLIGFYGGFVQVGVGFLLLAGLVQGRGLDLVSGNAVKVLLIATYTMGALILFAAASQVNVGLGIALAAGNATGALVSSRLALRKGAGWIRWFLVVAAVAAGVKMLFD